jgi:hypothetical protein
MFKEMNFHFSHQSSNPATPAMQSVSGDGIPMVNARPGCAAFMAGWLQDNAEKKITAPATR